MLETILISSATLAIALIVQAIRQNRERHKSREM